MLVVNLNGKRIGARDKLRLGYIDRSVRNQVGTEASLCEAMACLASRNLKVMMRKADWV
jgi:hypothetical protein